MKWRNYIWVSSLLVLIVFKNAQCFGQDYDPAIQPRIDSLKLELERINLDDTTRIQIMYSIGEETWLFRVGYWDTVVMMSKNALASNPTFPVVRTLNEIQAGALNNLGYI